MTESISLTVNGKAVSASVDPRMLLVQFIREQLQLTGTHVGCDTAQCGACTVHLNGRAVKSCSMLALQAQGAQIVTIEGLSAEGSHPLQVAWRALNVPQCGYCQAGQIMQAASLLKDAPNPQDNDIDQAMSGNICRCGTYPRIRAAIKQAAGAMAQSKGVAQ